MKKLPLILLVFLLTTGFQAFSQGMPQNKTTKKVSYAAEVAVPGVSQAELQRRAAYFLSGFSQFRGTFNGIYIDAATGQVRSVIQIHLGNEVINGAFRMQVTEGKYQYELTDLFGYSIPTGNVYANAKKEAPLEKADNFNVFDFSKKNDNAKNTHEVLVATLAAMNQNMKNPGTGQ